MSNENEKFPPAQRAVYDKLAAEGGGTWATYMMIDIDAAWPSRTILSDEAVERAEREFRKGDALGMTERMRRALTAAFSPPPEPAPSSPVPVEARGTSLLSDERIDGLVRLWAVDHPSVEGGLYEGTYAQDIYLLLIAEKARRTVDIPTPPTGGSNG